MSNTGLPNDPPPYPWRYTPERDEYFLETGITSSIYILDNGWGIETQEAPNFISATVKRFLFGRQRLEANIAATPDGFESAYTFSSRDSVDTLLDALKFSS